MALKSAAQLEKFIWDVSWNSINWGFKANVSPKIKLVLKPIKTGDTGDAELGKRFVGLEGTIDIEFQEPIYDLIRKSMPWNSVSATTLVISPPINTDLYTYAQALRLHPNTVAAADVSRDIVLTKACPIGGIEIPTDGLNDVKLKAQFGFWLDRAGLAADPPTISYGTVGV